MSDDDIDSSVGLDAEKEAGVVDWTDFGSFEVLFYSGYLS